jgi:hypothetical protein
LRLRPSLPGHKRAHAGLGFRFGSAGWRRSHDTIYPGHDHPLDRGKSDSHRQVSWLAGRSVGNAAFPDRSSGCSLLQEPASRAHRLQLQGQLWICTIFPFEAPRGTDAIARRRG